MIKDILIDAKLMNNSAVRLTVPSLAPSVKCRAVVFAAAGSSLGQFLVPPPPDTKGWTWYRAESAPPARDFAPSLWAR
jgi:hypothetical protein